MHQTIYGETPKVEIFEKSAVESFLKEESRLFDSLVNYDSCIYPDKSVINDAALNYLNTFNSENSSTPRNQLKNILKKEYDECEKIYPYLGEVFLNMFFDNKVLFSKKNHIFRKDTSEFFLKTVSERNAKNIVKWIIDNSSLDRIMNIEKSYSSDIHLVKKDNIFVRANYDRDFLGKNTNLEVHNYRFAIIDGFIESVGEIHHMLHFAAKSKEPHVIFCFGMSEEVKRVIIDNNTRRITHIIPVSMSVEEETINILNDIALLHNSDVISSQKGQTISQEMRKSLSLGRKIIFKTGGFEIEPVCSVNQIKRHINFLKNRIDNSPPDANTDLIRNRIKNLNPKSLSVFVPKKLSSDIEFNRSLDYGLRMMSSSREPYYSIILNRKNIMLPVKLHRLLLKKVNITKDILYNIDKLLVVKE